jgi:hypothetical protein
MLLSLRLRKAVKFFAFFWLFCSFSSFAQKGKVSDNKLYKEKVGWEVSQPLEIGLRKTYFWIKSQVDDNETNTSWIYESPDKGKTVYKRKPSSTQKIKIS